MPSGSAAWGDSLAVFMKLNIHLTYKPSTL